MLKRIVDNLYYIVGCSRSNTVCLERIFVAQLHSFDYWNQRVASLIEGSVTFMEKVNH